MSEHEGMMTRREVLEDICEAPGRLRRDGYDRAYAMGAEVALGNVLGVKTIIDAAHELALLIDAEREEER